MVQHQCADFWEAFHYKTCRIWPPYSGHSETRSRRKTHWFEHRGEFCMRNYREKTHRTSVTAIAWTVGLRAKIPLGNTPAVMRAVPVRQSSVFSWHVGLQAVEPLAVTAHARLPRHSPVVMLSVHLWSPLCYPVWPCSGVATETKSSSSGEDKSCYCARCCDTIDNGVARGMSEPSFLLW